MKFKVFAELKYTPVSEGTLFLNIQALHGPQQNIIEEALTIDGGLPSVELIYPETGNRLARIELPKGPQLKITYTALVENAWKINEYEANKANNVKEMGTDILPYLYPSRYCECDKISRFADNLFGKISDPYDKVLAIVEWIYQNIKYTKASSTSRISSFDIITSQVGVCKDFAHLGITLCRAVSIPARYFTGYSYQLIPQNFHACFEAYLGGQWVLFDPTRLAPLNGMVKIAHGRDAADCSVANMFGSISFNSVTVNCELAEGETFEPIYYLPNKYHGITYQ